MSCKFIEECPSASGWCDGIEEPRADCAYFLITSYGMLLKRFRHLMKSDYIRLFDEVNPRTREYKLDIKEADKALEKQREAMMIIQVPETKWELYIGAKIRLKNDNEIEGNILYKPEHNCYYVDGRSIPKEYVLYIKHKEYVEVSKLEQLIEDIQR